MLQTKIKQAGKAAFSSDELISLAADSGMTIAEIDYVLDAMRRASEARKSRN